MNKKLKKTIPIILGIILTFSIAIASFYLAKIEFFKSISMSVLTLSIVIGIILGNSIFKKIESKVDPGVNFVKGHFLRLGIILYGFNITFQEIQGVGIKGILIDTIMIVSIFSIAMFIGVKILKINKKTVALIGCGSSICGAAAVLAAEPVVEAEESDVAIAIATVVIFGTISMFLYPVLYHIAGLNEKQFGIYIGSSVHEVAQVVGAGSAIGKATEEIAVIEKMIRVMLLAPFLIILSIIFKPSDKNGKVSKIKIPWFAVIFIAVGGFNSLNLLDTKIVEIIKLIDLMLLAMAMSGLGLKTHASSITKAGSKPLILAFILFVCLISISYALQLIIPITNL